MTAPRPLDTLGPPGTLDPPDTLSPPDNTLGPPGTLGRSDTVSQPDTLGRPDTLDPPGTLSPPDNTLGPPGTLGVARPDVLDDWAELFRALSDGNRLRILLAVHHAPGICVTDLAEAVGMSANATSHALGLLRVRGIVRSERSGRERRWCIASEQIHTMLHQVGATHSPLHPEH